MKILHVETGRHFYGGAQQVAWLLRGLQKHGVDNLLVAVPDAAIATEASRDGIEVRHTRCSGDLDFGFAWRLWRLINKEQPDVVHCHSRRGADLLGGMAARLAGVPAVLSRRVDSSEQSFLAGVRYGAYQKVVAISEHIATVLAADGLDVARIEVIRSAVDAESVNTQPDEQAFRRQFDIEDGAFVIAMIAQLIPRKGHRFLFDVIPNLRETYPQIRVLLFGTGPEERALRSLAAKLNLHGTVRFAGYDDKLDDYLACIDLLVHPATREGLGVAMLKAAAAGVPVLAFDTAGSREAVVHGKTGILVPPDDVAMLQKAIAVMIDEPEMRRELGAAGRQRMKDEFPVETMVERHLELYASLKHA